MVNTILLSVYIPLDVIYKSSNFGEKILPSDILFLIPPSYLLSPGTCVFKSLSLKKISELKLSKSLGKQTEIQQKSRHAEIQKW